MSGEIIHKESLPFKLWEGTKALFSGFLCFTLMGLFSKSYAFPERCDGGSEITPVTAVLQYI